MMLKSSYSSLLLLLLSLFISRVNAQEEETGNWIMYFGSSKFHPGWSIHHEVQYRSHSLLPNTEQWLLRGGLTYGIADNASATAGYGYISNHYYTDAGNRGVLSDEHRIWQQFLMQNSLGRITFDHRYRMEQRFLRNNVTRNYLDRFRYFIRVTIPLNKPALEPNTSFLSFYDEIFLHLTSNPFDRNRLYGAFGYRFSKEIAIQTGYLLQTIGVDTKPYLQFALFWNLDFTDADTEQ